MNPFLDQIIAGYEQYYNTQYAQISSLTFMTWEYLITLSDEIELFWVGTQCLYQITVEDGSNTSDGAVEYSNPYPLLHRTKSLLGRSFTPLLYVPSFLDLDIGLHASLIGAHLSTVSCQAWFHYIIGISALTVVCSVNLILSLRIYGLYGRARWVAILLGTILSATTAVQAYIVAQFSPDFILIPLPFSKNIVACDPISTAHLYLALIPGLGFDALALTLVLVRGLLHIQRQRGVGSRGSTIVRVLTRDSASYFMIIVLIYTALTISWVKSPGIEAFTTFGYGLAMISVAGSRMLLNLKRESMPPT
ncbi:hypothetical protein ONZ45_g10212 [Pleurotus djamor]|nr:hypothetical protein ONZ45_g10212 [Pleurotus djamor]